MKLLLEPVTVSCGHTFCRACLEQSLGYRSLCAVCRAPVVSGQGVNVLIKNIIADNYPRALAQRLQELEDELRANEHEADTARRHEVGGGSSAGAEGNEPILPFIRGFNHQLLIFPHCRGEIEFQSPVDSRLVEYALQGSRRFGVIDGNGEYDENARPLGICFEIENVERSTHHGMRARLMGKFRFWLSGPPHAHEDGFELGRCEAFFDTPLPTNDLNFASESSTMDNGDVSAPLCVRTTPEVAKSALDLLEGQLVNVGEGGRRFFAAKFGEAPAICSGGNTATAGTSTSASMERFSFWLLNVLVSDDAHRQQWLASVDTRARLESCCSVFEAAGSRPVLDLPGARSWMNAGQSAFGSFALLFAIIALLVAKAMGFFDQHHHGNYDQNIEDAWVIGQLLR